MVEAVEAALGPVDVLVLNATGPQPEAPLTEVGWEDHLVQLDFFVRSPVLLGRAVVEGMKRRGAGRIIHIDSEVADLPPRDGPPTRPPRAPRSASPAPGPGRSRPGGSP